MGVAIVGRLKLAAWWIAHLRDEKAGLVEQARGVRRAVGPDSGASAEVKSSPLRMYLVGVDPNGGARFQDVWAELVARGPVVGDVDKPPARQVLGPTAKIDYLDVLVPFGLIDLAIVEDAGYLDVSL